MKNYVGLTIQIEGNKVIINKEPETPEEMQRFYAALLKAYANTVDSMAESAIREGLKHNEK